MKRPRADILQSSQDVKDTSDILDTQDKYWTTKTNIGHPGQILDNQDKTDDTINKCTWNNSNLWNKEKKRIKATFRFSRSPLSSDTYNIVNGHTQVPRRPGYKEYMKSGWFHFRSNWFSRLLDLVILSRLLDLVILVIEVGAVLIGMSRDGRCKRKQSLCFSVKGLLLEHGELCQKFGKLSAAGETRDILQIFQSCHDSTNSYWGFRAFIIIVKIITEP